LLQRPTDLRKHFKQRSTHLLRSTTACVNWKTRLELDTAPDGGTVYEYYISGDLLPQHGNTVGFLSGAHEWFQQHKKVARQVSLFLRMISFGATISNESGTDVDGFPKSHEIVKRLPFFRWDV
jgi:hypothetical protein